jgi:hypothetical protein
MHVLDLHDLAEAALADNLEQFKVFNLKGSLSILHELHTHSHLTRTILQIDPLSTELTQILILLGPRQRGLFPVLLAKFGVLDVRLHLFKAWLDGVCAKEDVIVAAGVGRGVGISNVEGDVDVCGAGNIELVLRVFARPQWILWSAAHRVDEDLLLIEVDEGVWKVF